MNHSFDPPASGDPFDEHRVMAATDVARTVDRMAHQIIEKLAGSEDAALIGIPTRGVTLARRLAARIAAFDGPELPVGVLDITLFRDDLRRVGVRPLTETVEPPGGIDDRLIILVDDVLFSGRSTRAALDALRELGRPRTVQLAVLVDRGHRQLPIRADYVGKNLPTARDGSVRVRLIETDGEDCVYVSTGTPQ
ncbi:MAG: bifunctional pyr operon transcriptional regulator/uracil phosphoribosyltransferase PyrR [bacterium]